MPRATSITRNERPYHESSRAMSTIPDILPRHGMVVVEIDHHDEYRYGAYGLVIPTGAQVDDVTGVVVAIGPEAQHYRRGQRVLFNRGHGENVLQHNVKFRVLHEDQILGSYELPEGV